MTDDKMRAALEATAKWFSEHISLQDEGAEVIQRVGEALAAEPVGMSDADIERAKEAAYRAGYEQREKEILEAPKTGVPGGTLEAFEQVKQELDDLKSYILMQSGGHIRNQIMQLPGRIKEQSLEVAKTAELIEMERSRLDKKKNEHLTFVLSATENGKPKFTNEQARRAAVESLIADDLSYAEVHDSLTLKEALLKRQQIELEHLHNLFRAYLTTANMQGVR